MASASDAVWLSVLPDMSGFGPGIIKGAGKEAQRTGALVGGRFGTAMLAGALVVGAGAILATKALYGVGKTFADVTNTIRVGTGATGRDLDGLVDSAKNVGRNVPAEFDAIADTVADVNTRLGLTGPTLEKFSSQALEAGRIMGEEIDINSVSSAFSVFRIEGEATTDAMDHIFRVSQATGVGMNELADIVSKNGPAMQQLGFSFEETAGLAGNLDKAGLDTSRVMGLMGRSLSRLAEDGKDPQQEFRNLVDEIGGFIEAGEDGAAIELGAEMFGRRGSEQLVQAIGDGTLALDDLAEVAGMTDDTILGAGAETMNFAEQWQMFKNNVLIELEPVATRVFGVITDAMEWLKDHGVPAIQEFGQWLDRSKTWLLPLVAGLGSMLVALTGVVAVVKGVQLATRVWAGAQAALNVVMLANPLGLIILAVVGLVAAFVTAYKSSETFRDIVDGVWEAVKGFFSSAWDWIKGIFDKLSDAWDAVASFFSDTATGISEAFTSLGDRFEAVWAAIDLYVLTPWRIAWALVKTLFTGDTDHIKGAFSGIKDRFLIVWEAIKSAVFDKFTAAFNAVKGFFSDRADNIKDAWAKLKDKFVAVWNLIDRLVFAPFRAAFALVRAIFSGDSEEIRRTWNNLKNKMVGTYLAIKNAVFDVFKNAFRAVANFFSDRVDNIKGYWDGLKNNLKAGYDWINTNVFQKFRDGLSWLGDKVNDAKNRIGRLWDAVKDKFATPINWVIDNVWNKGIKRVFQAVVDVIPGLNITIPEVGRIGGGGGYGTSGGGFTGAGVQARAKGGPFKKGWVLAGEEGPELIRADGPGYTYTARETKAMLAGQGVNPAQESFSPSNPPHGGPTVGTNAWFLEKAAGVGDWVLGGLAKAAELVLKPVRSALSTAAGGGKFGDLVGGTSTWAMDEAIKWIKKEDEEAAGGPWDGISDLKGRSLRGAKGHVNAAAFTIADAIQPGMFMQAFNRSMQGAHGLGLAVDFMAKGGNLQKTADFMVANHKKLNGLWEVIYNHKMWTKGRGWRPLRGGMGNDPGHVWHVHGGWGKAAGMADGGMLKPGQFAYHEPHLTKPDRVLTDRQWNILQQNIPADNEGKSFNAYVTMEAGSAGEEIADSVLYAMRRMSRGGVYASR